MLYQMRAASRGMSRAFACAIRVLMTAGTVLSCLGMLASAQAAAPANIAPEYPRYTGATGTGQSSQEHTTVEAVLGDIQSQFPMESDAGRCAVTTVRRGGTFIA